MSDVKEKRLGKLKRKRIWPSILVFVLFVLSCGVAFALFMYLCIVCIMGTKIVGHYEEAQQVSGILDALMDGGDTVIEAAEDMHGAILNNKDIYILDRDKNTVFVTGDSEPNFSIALELNLRQEFSAVADSKSSFTPDKGLNAVLALPAGDIFGGVLDTMGQGKCVRSG